MEASKLIGLIDVGNTATKWSVVNTEDLDGSVDNVAFETRTYDQSTSFDFADSISWSIISVNAERLNAIRERLSTERAGDKIALVENKYVPLVNKTANPNAVGTDRLVAAYAATELLPGKDRIVIDSGTAITIDVVNRQNEFLGGTIMPGIKLMLTSLFKGTDQLPPLNSLVWHQPPEPLGDRTETAILSGVYHAVWYGILNIVKGQSEMFPGASVIFTGPSLENFACVIPDYWTAADDLVFSGLLRLALENKSITK